MGEEDSTADPDHDHAPSDTAIRQLDESEYQGAALALAQAFEHDELARYFVHTPDRSHWSEQDKWDLHLSIMQYITYAHCIRGIATTIGANYASVALWMPPNSNLDSITTVLRSGIWRLIYKLSRIGRRRFFFEFFPLLHHTKAQVLGPRDKTSYYLVYIGTKPEARGKGYAEKLIEHISERADAEGRACYLESSAEKNVALYRRCGYGVERRIVVGNVPLDIMVREPRISTATRASRGSAGVHG